MLKVVRKVLPFHRLSSTAPCAPSTFFPYGKADFASIRKQRQFYIDKTCYIPSLEAVEHGFFVRPPRFGKSALLSMLSSYYDKRQEGDFDDLFEELWIHQEENRTDLRNKFHVLSLNFSLSVEGGPDKIMANLHDCINEEIYDFERRYGFTGLVVPDNSFSSFRRLVSHLHGDNLMVLIDEYDRFANKLMFEAPELYSTVVSGKSGDPSSSPIRSFLETLKGAKGLARYRTLITGITPLALADASGYNVARDITHKVSISGICGMSKKDVIEGLQKALGLSEITQEVLDLFDVVKTYYNGYLFIGSDYGMFNPTLVLYFLNGLAEPGFKDKVIALKRNPPLPANEAKEVQFLFDDNVRISDQVLRVARKLKTAASITYNLANRDHPFFVSSLEGRFCLRDLILGDSSPTTSEPLRLPLSFLYAHGLLTLKKPSQHNSDLQLIAPNRLIVLDHVPRLADALSELNRQMSTFLKSPSANHLQQLLNDYRKKVPDATGAIHSHIYMMFNSLAPDNLLSSDEPIDKGDECSLRPDLILACDGQLIVIELKRIRMNAVVVPTHLNIKVNYDEKGHLYPPSAQKLQDFLDSMEVPKLLDFKSNQKYYGSSVRSVVKSAHQQVMKQVKEIRKIEQYKKYEEIYSFVAVQVGSPFVVEEEEME